MHFCHLYMKKQKEGISPLEIPGHTTVYKIIAAVG